MSSLANGLRTALLVVNFDILPPAPANTGATFSGVPEADVQAKCLLSLATLAGLLSPVGPLAQGEQGILLKASPHWLHL